MRPPARKHCPGCRRTLPASCFYKSRFSYDGLLHYCRGCWLVIGRKLKLRNRLLHIVYLWSHPCVDCGESDPIVLEFDHQGKKSETICELVNRGTAWRTVELEMSRCHVRCANCHRRKTARERGWLKALSPAKFQELLAECRLRPSWPIGAQGLAPLPQIGSGLRLVIHLVLDQVPEPAEEGGDGVEPPGPMLIPVAGKEALRVEVLGLGEVQQWLGKAQKALGGPPVKLVVRHKFERLQGDAAIGFQALNKNADFVGG